MPWNRFKPSSRSIFTDRSKVVLLLWIIFVSYASCLCVLCLFLVAVWPHAGKGLTYWLSCLLCFVTFPNVSSTTSELRVRLAPWNWFKPPVKYFTDRSKTVLLLWIFLWFVSVLCLLCLCARLFICALWSLASRLWCLLWVCHFPIGILCQVWYLIVSIPDLCTLTYFV